MKWRVSSQAAALGLVSLAINYHHLDEKPDLFLPLRPDAHPPIHQSLFVLQQNAGRQVTAIHYTLAFPLIRLSIPVQYASLIISWSTVSALPRFLG